MLKNKLANIKNQYTQFKAQTKKRKIISLAVFVVVMLLVAALAILRSLKVIGEGSEGILLLIIAAIIFVGIIKLPLLPKEKFTDQHFYNAWIGEVLQEYADVLSLDDRDVKMLSTQ